MNKYIMVVLFGCLVVVSTIRVSYAKEYKSHEEATCLADILFEQLGINHAKGSKIRFILEIDDGEYFDRCPNDDYSNLNEHSYIDFDFYARPTNLERRYPFSFKLRSKRPYRQKLDSIALALACVLKDKKHVKSYDRIKSILHRHAFRACGLN